MFFKSVGIILLLKHSNGTPSEKDELLEPLTGESSSSLTTPKLNLKAFFKRIQDVAEKVQDAAFKTMIRLELYCENIHSPVEAEKLLNIGK